MLLFGTETLFSSYYISVQVKLTDSLIAKYYTNGYSLTCGRCNVTTLEWMWIFLHEYGVLLQSV